MLLTAVGRKPYDDPSQIRIGLERAEVVPLVGLPESRFRSNGQEIDVYSLDGGRRADPLFALVQLPFEVITFGLWGVGVAEEWQKTNPYRLLLRYDEFDRLMAVEAGDQSNESRCAAKTINESSEKNDE